MTLVRAWRWFSGVITIVAVSFALAFALVESFAREGPVIQRIGEIDNPTFAVKRSGTLGYSIDVERLESCPADLIITLKSHPKSGPPAIITIQRPTWPTSYMPGVQPHVFIGLVLPESVYPGKWTYIGGVESRCPTRKRFDETARFDFEVIE